jgi:ABC-type antimicrobial peptide transport system permease subunit
VLALVLALIGLYSVVSYAVTRRLREVGIRMALGARSYQIVRLILMRSLALVGGGTLLGVVGSLLLSHLMEGLLFGVRPGDPLTIVAVAFLLVGAAIAAAAIPARRAVRLDAMTVLRTE